MYKPKLHKGKVYMSNLFKELEEIGEKKQRRLKKLRL